MDVTRARYVHDTRRVCLPPPARPLVTPTTTETLYQRMAPVYDAIYGALLQPGRRRAMTRLAPQPGEHILEIGVGTGFGLRTYPAQCRVVAIDLSRPMLERASERRRKHGLGHVTLSQMDACRLAFADETFDAVYAPYVINVVPEPVRVVREMLRVCRPGGRLVLLNHFDDTEEAANAVNRLAGRAAALLSGVNWRVPLHRLLDETGLAAASIEPVNVPRVSSVVVCHKGATSMRAL